MASQGGWTVGARCRFFDGVLVLAIVAMVLVTARAAAPLTGQTLADRFTEACQKKPENPYVATTFAPRGGRRDREMAVLAFRAPPDGGELVTLTTAGRVGACYGLAYDSRNLVLYAGAFHKRATHFGPAGPGGIYAIDLVSGQVRTFATVPNAGRDWHQPANDYHPDVASREPTGKTSLGDVDISPDFRELTAVNLFDRQIYRFAVPDGTLLGSFPHGAANEPWAEDARPYGLGYRGDRLYHGVVRSAQSSQNPDELTAFVYESAYDGSDMRLVASAPLHFDRGWIWPNSGRAMWLPWKDRPGSIIRDGGRYPQPMLSDIVFTESGDQMILGFRDRFGDMVIYTTPPNQPPAGEFFYNTPAGDILPAWPEGTGWRIQTTPEYYREDYGPAPGNHDETSYGGLGLIPGYPRLVTSANSPREISSGGAIWLRTDTGRDIARLQVYKFGEGDNFGKANGLGDVEILCPARESPTPTSTLTPTLTATAPATEMPTGTPTESPTATATVITPTATVATPTATVTTTATATVVTPTVTLTAWTPHVTATPMTPTPITPTATSLATTTTPEVPASPTPNATVPDTPVPAPSVTPEVPTLPKTGGMGDAGGIDPSRWSVGLGLALMALALPIWWRERRALGSQRRW